VPGGGSDTAVLIVAGSGPTDRNGNSGAGLNTYCYKMLSDELVGAGVAVMRYDKRGVGFSFVNDPSTYADVVFEAFVDDAKMCVDYLRSAGFKRVVVAGHSEGGAIALHLALRDNVAVDSLVLLSAAGFPMDKILNAQLSAQLVPQYLGLMMTATNIIQRIKRGEEVALESLPKELLSLFHPSVQKFLCSSMAFDPAELISRVEQPVLIISGGRDIQVTKENAIQLLSKAKRGEHINFENMTHILKDADTSDRIEQLMGVYTNSNLHLTEGLTAAIVKFINR
jgi:pimeloyl-ACP methyl ester carboxylesterase